MRYNVFKIDENFFQIKKKYEISITPLSALIGITDNGLFNFQNSVFIN